MNNFDRNPRRKQELMGRPIVDGLYRKIFGDIEITRYEHEDDYLLDKEFAIDVRIKFPMGLILLGQEKFLSPQYASFNSVTVEYEQNQHTGEIGDWFKLACQFYFVGYLNKNMTAFYPWIMLNWTSTVLATLLGEIKWQHNTNKDGHARASFKYTQMNKFPKNCVIAKSDWGMFENIPEEDLR